MSISSLTSSSAITSLQSAANSSDPLQQDIGAALLKRSIQQEGQSALQLVLSATQQTTATPASPGSLGYSVDVHA